MPQALQGPQQPGHPFGPAQLAGINQVDRVRGRLGSGAEPGLVITGPHDLDAVPGNIIQSDDVMLLSPAQGHDAIQFPASRQHPGAQMGTEMELAQVGAVAGGHQRQMRQHLAGHGGEQPEMMAVDNLGLKPGDHVQEPVRKTPFIRFHFRGRQIRETPAGIGHDVAHAHHRKGEITTLEAHKFTGRGPQPVRLSLFSLGHPGQEKVFMPPAGGFPDHGLNIDATPRSLRPLTEQMENLHTYVTAGITCSCSRSRRHQARDFLCIATRTTTSPISAILR